MKKTQTQKRNSSKMLYRFHFCGLSRFGYTLTHSFSLNKMIIFGLTLMDCALYIFDDVDDGG